MSAPFLHRESTDSLIVCERGGGRETSCLFQLHKCTCVYEGEGVGRETYNIL